MKAINKLEKELATLKKSLDELEALPILEEIIAEYKRDLEEAKTDPNYDDEFRDQDIQAALEEIRKLNKKIARIKKQLERAEQ